MQAPKSINIIVPDGLHRSMKNIVHSEDNDICNVSELIRIAVYEMMKKDFPEEAVKINNVTELLFKRKEG